MKRTVMGASVPVWAIRAHTRVLDAKTELNVDDVMLRYDTATFGAPVGERMRVADVTRNGWVTVADERFDPAVGEWAEVNRFKIRRSKMPSARVVAHAPWLEPNWEATPGFILAAAGSRVWSVRDASDAPKDRASYHALRGSVERAGGIAEWRGRTDPEWHRIIADPDAVESVAGYVATMAECGAEVTEGDRFGDCPVNGHGPYVDTCIPCGPAPDVAPEPTPPPVAFREYLVTDPSGGDYGRDADRDLCVSIADTLGPGASVEGLDAQLCHTNVIVYRVPDADGAPDSAPNEEYREHARSWAQQRWGPGEVADAYAAWFVANGDPEATHTAHVQAFASEHLGLNRDGFPVDTHDAAPDTATAEITDSADTAPTQGVTMTSSTPPATIDAIERQAQTVLDAMNNHRYATARTALNEAEEAAPTGYRVGGKFTFGQIRAMITSREAAHLAMEACRAGTPADTADNGPAPAQDVTPTVAEPAPVKPAKSVKAHPPVRITHTPDGGTMLTGTPYPLRFSVSGLLNAARGGIGWTYDKTAGNVKGGAWVLDGSAGRELDAPRVRATVAALAGLEISTVVDVDGYTPDGPVAPAPVAPVKAPSRPAPAVKATPVAPVVAPQPAPVAVLTVPSLPEIPGLTDAQHAALSAAFEAAFLAITGQAPTAPVTTPAPAPVVPVTVDGSVDGLVTRTLPAFRECQGSYRLQRTIIREALRAAGVRARIDTARDNKRGIVVTGDTVGAAPILADVLATMAARVAAHVEPVAV